ncbi:hypothetical protein GGX14DRAFT_562788 [Mycena pura]|uniref:Uncharacterized protein n=1 Tax=Mycena pura TaxID=153505 RepID=A0AAD6YGB9_9AGAR|nr:hypothetical protein GGX14DRAFT_562788 [Mycena pura]
MAAPQPLLVPPMGMALGNAVVVAGRQFRQNGSTGPPATPVAVIPGAICWQLVLFVLAPNQVALFSQLQNAAGVWLGDDIPAGLSFGCLTGLGWAHNMPRIMVPDWALPAWPTSGHTCSTSAKCPIYGPTLCCPYITVSTSRGGDPGDTQMRRPLNVPAVASGIIRWVPQDQAACFRER